MPGLTCVGWRAWPWAHNPGARLCSVSGPGRDPWAYSSHSGCSLLRLAESLALHQRKGLAVQSAQHLLFPLATARGRTWPNSDACPSGDSAPTAPSRSQLLSVGSGGTQSLPSTTSHGGQTKQAPPSKTKANNKNSLCFLSLPWEDNQ